MSRERTKELIKVLQQFKKLAPSSLNLSLSLSLSHTHTHTQTMDSHGLLLPEHSSTVIKAKTTRERKPSGGQLPPVDNDEWIKHSPAYLQLREG